ncbi:claudin-3-like [Oryzias melastigma]|uniref:claudin-3-like n=1 Tax=Oryzias melastigma TaxID=30732 RepID=UPI000CF80287|nr:claudin-3-like [Oryzias melastigma]
MSKILELAGIYLGFIGFIGALVTCVLPQWKMTAYIEDKTISPQANWDGLWMSCMVESTGPMECHFYNSILKIPSDLQASRAMTVMAIIAALLGVLISIVEAKCIEEEAAKAKVMIVSGILFILAGLLVLIPVSWSANTVMQDFYNPMLKDSEKREIGTSLYIGWASAGLLLLGGTLLCNRCPPKEEKYKPRRTAYSAPNKVSTSGGHDKKDYV